jgi:hypothetical protein
VLHYGEFALVPIDLEYVSAQTPSDSAGIEFYLEHNATRHDVKGTAEAKKGRHFCLAAAGTLHRKATQLVFNDGGHRHAVILS